MARRGAFLAASCLGLVVSLTVSLVGGELVIRAVHLMRDGIPFVETPSGRVGAIVLDPRLGWRATERYAQNLVETTATGVAYAVHRSQGPHGFRQYGNRYAHKPKLLVMGDSFTQASAVSDNKTYHALLRQQLGIEVFAYGAGGYGTLQEYLVLDEIIDEIQPTMILWQFCTNDFINNDHDLEVASTLNNNGWIRPYWEQGQVRLRSPKRTGVQLREWISHHSRFLYFLLSRLDRLRARTTIESIEHAIKREGMAHPGFARSVRTTDELIGKVRERVGQIPIHAFSCEDEEPYGIAFQTIAAHYDIQYWKDVPHAVQDALQAGQDVLASDGHWNEQGHALIARRLARYLQTHRPAVALK